MKMHAFAVNIYLLIWLEAMFQPNIGNTVLTVFARFCITPPKVNLFG